jgi:RNA polymerase sigma factor (sigma-70 family)
MSDTLQLYLDEIERYPLLSATEEQQLAERMASGDFAAREQMINAHLRLAVHVARKHQRPGIDLLDLIQEANLGLLKATEKYDHSKGRFAAYATWWIKERIIMALASHFTDHLSLEDADSLTLEAIPDDGPAPEEVLHLQQLTTALYATLAVLTERERLALVLRYGLDGRGRNRTLAQVGKHLQTSPENARRIVELAIRKIRKSGESAALHDYWSEHCAS